MVNMFALPYRSRSAIKNLLQKQPVK